MLVKQQKKPWYRALLSLIKIFHKKSTFVFLGEKLEGPAVILSNHVGASGPLSLEVHFDTPVRIWGAHEMSESLRSAYKYQTEIYYHQKHGWNIHLARLACLIITPLTYMFYCGLNLIPTYRDIRFCSTVRESLKVIGEGQSIVIFPEDSDNGYHDHLTSFHCGFLAFLRIAKKRGYDLPIYVAYLDKKTKLHLFDVPVKYSDLVASGATHEELAEMLCQRCNELGEMCRSGKIAVGGKNKSLASSKIG